MTVLWYSAGSGDHPCAMCLMYTTNGNGPLISVSGKIKINGGVETTFAAVCAGKPDAPIQNPPDYRDKWGHRW